MITRYLEKNRLLLLQDITDVDKDINRDKTDRWNKKNLTRGGNRLRTNWRSWVWNSATEGRKAWSDHWTENDEYICMTDFQILFRFSSSINPSFPPPDFYILQQPPRVDPMTFARPLCMMYASLLLAWEIIIIINSGIPTSSSVVKKPLGSLL